MRILMLGNSFTFANNMPAMLAELTDGESRAQILSLLGQDSIDALLNSVGGVKTSE